MATYYGEVLAPLSRAVDDDEDHDVPIDEIELLAGNEEDKSMPKAEFLFFGVGLPACIYLEAYVLGLTDNADSPREPPVLMIQKQHSENDSETLLNGLDYRRQENVLARVHRSARNPEVLVCLCPERISEEHSAAIPNLLLNSPVCSSIRMVTALKSASITEFKHPYSIEALSTPVLRYLSSTTYPEDKVLSHVGRWLEQPNVLSGVIAAALTECEVRSLSALACVCYVDTDDSSAVRAFCPLLKCSPFKNISQNSVHIDQLVDRLVLKRTRFCGNLYN